METSNFIARERAAQAAFFARKAPVASIHPDAPYRLVPENRSLNIAPSSREAVEAYFGPPRNVVWHRHAGHGLSSQACCLNFLAPLATQPALLARIVGAALDIPPPRMQPVSDDASWFVDFEWTGRADYLGEAVPGRVATRGANATSADAAVRFEHDGRLETLLIEWKYTERYGAPISERGNPTRVSRYAAKAFTPDGPLRTDLGLSLEDFFWEPFYQLLRQQILAHRMQSAREDGAERVRVLHLSPSANVALHRVTSPPLRRFGSDALVVFNGLLARPDDFVSRTIEQTFGMAVTDAHPDTAAENWAEYLRERYRFLSASPAAT